MPHAGDDRFFGRPAHELFEVRADGHAGPHHHLDAVAGHRFQRPARFRGIGTVDDFGIHARADRGEQIPSRQVDRLGGLPVDFNLGPIRGDQRLDDVRHISSRQVMGLQGLGGDGIDAGDPRLDRHDLAVHDHRRVDFPQGHQHELDQRNVRAGHPALNPQADITKEDRQSDQ